MPSRGRFQGPAVPNDRVLSLTGRYEHKLKNRLGNMIDFCKACFTGFKID
jgi:hypothetical protein